MKKLFLIVLIALFVSVGTLQLAHADQGDKYIGVKMGTMMIDASNIDDITAMGFLLGVGVTPEVSVEGEFNIGVSGGDVDGGVVVIDGEVYIWTLGAYVVYRHPILDNVSLKGKVGFLIEYVSEDIDTIFGRYSDDSFDLGNSVGAGVTVGITDVLSAEVEYTIIEADVDYLSVGLNYKF